MTNTALKSVNLGVWDLNYVVTTHFSTIVLTFLHWF